MSSFILINTKQTDDNKTRHRRIHKSSYKEPYFPLLDAFSKGKPLYLEVIKLNTSLVIQHMTRSSCYSYALILSIINHSTVCINQLPIISICI